MKGSEKQIKWANDIISAANKAWDDLKTEVTPEAQVTFEVMKNDFFAKMSSDQAEVIIASRMKYPEDAKHLKTNIGFFTKVSI